MPFDPNTGEWVGPHYDSETGVWLGPGPDPQSATGATYPPLALEPAVLPYARARRNRSNLVALAILLVAGLAYLSWTTNHQRDLSAGSSGSTGAQTTSAPSTYHQPRILWQASGSGDLNGPAFTIPAWASGWKEAWSLRCPYSYGGSISVIFQGIPEATQTSDFGADQDYQGPGAWRSTNFLYDHGRFAPEVTATCPWTEKVIALP